MGVLGPWATSALIAVAAVVVPAVYDQSDFQMRMSCASNVFLEWLSGMDPSVESFRPEVFELLARRAKIDPEYDANNVRSFEAEIPRSNPEAPPLPLRMYSPDVRGSLPVIVYLHSGLFFTGHHSWAGDDALCRFLSAELGAMVVSPDLRDPALARWATEHRGTHDGIPQAEGPFPQQLKDVLAVLAWVNTKGAGTIRFDSNRVAVVGVESGGGLAITASLVAAAENAKEKEAANGSDAGLTFATVRAISAASPVFDPSETHPSQVVPSTEFAPLAALKIALLPTALTASSCCAGPAPHTAAATARASQGYAYPEEGTAERRAVDAAQLGPETFDPRLASTESLGALPPLEIIGASLDPYEPQGNQFAATVVAAGADARVTKFKRVPPWFVTTPAIGHAEKARGLIVAHLAKHLG